MMLAHGGSAGLVAELAVILVPLAILGLFLWWARRHGVTDEEAAEALDAAEGGPNDPRRRPGDGPTGGRGS